MQLVRKSHSKGKARGIFFLILGFHALVIHWLLNSQYREAVESVPVLTYIRLPQDKPSPIYIEPLIIDFQRSVSSASKIAPPDVVIESASAFNVESGVPPSQGDFAGVFDPTLRQKLLQAKRSVSEQGFQIDEHWTGADGRSYIYVGNGECMVSMAKLDWRERGAQWSGTRVPCGKNDNEKMMDRVMADFESRKARK